MKNRTPRTRKLYKNPPEGLYNYILNQPHILIAGATGSGKSVLMHKLTSCIYSSGAEMIIIDPKKVEFYNYKGCKNVYYTDDPRTAAAYLRATVENMQRRYKVIRRAGRKSSAGLFPDTYIIIDELADLMIQAKREILPLLIQIAQLGRAAGIHLIMATQRSTAGVVSGDLKVNCDCRIALRLPTAQDSRNIIGSPGAEKLPRYGWGLMLTADGLKKIKIKL